MRKAALATRRGAGVPNSARTWFSAFGPRRSLPGTPGQGPGAAWARCGSETSATLTAILLRLGGNLSRRAEARKRPGLGWGRNGILPDRPARAERQRQKLEPRRIKSDF